MVTEGEGLRARGPRWAALVAATLAGMALVALWVVLVCSARPAAAASGATVTGTVRSSSGRPLWGVRVNVVGAAYGNLIATATSGPTGSYTLSGLPSYPVVVRFFDPIGTWNIQYFNGVPTFSAAARLSLPAGTTTTADAALVPSAGIITGTVVGSTGGLSNITITVLDPATNATVSSTTTATDGTYKVTGLPAGSYLVRFSEKYSSYGTEYFPDAPTAGTATPLTLTPTAGAIADGELARGGTVSGRLTAGPVDPLDRKGPVTPAGIWAVLVTPQPVTIVAAARTYGNGNYTISNVTAGTYKLVFVDTTWTAGSSTGYRPRVYPDLDGGDPTTQLAAIAAGADQTVPAGGTLTGRDGDLRGADCSPAIDGHPDSAPGNTWANKKFMGCNLAGFDLAGRSLAGSDLTAVNLTSTNLTGADLAGANLSSTRGSGASFAGASMIDVDLRSAALIGANFDDATLDGAILDSAVLAGSSLRRTSMVGVRMYFTDLSGTSVDGLVLTGTYLYRVRSDYISGTPATLPPRWAVRADRLLGPEFDLRSANFWFADLSGVDLTGADLTNAGFYATDLTGATLTDATIWDTDFDDYTTLTGVRSGGLHGDPTWLPSGWTVVYTLNFGFLVGPGADLHAGDLRAGQFSGVDLTGADLSTANLQWSTMNDVDLTGADLTGATGVPTLSAVTYSNTTCPTGVNSDANGGTCVGQGW